MVSKPGNGAARVDRAAGVFVCGRQHSGNTMVTALLGRMPRFVATLDEDFLLECRPKLDKLPDAAQRAKWMGEHLQLKQPDVEAAIARDLDEWARQHPTANTIAVFQKASEFVMAALGKQAWARKATSYIFHAETILREMPGVRLIYLVRNPFDLISSMKLRDSGHEFIVGSSISWSSGIDKAVRLEKQFPDRVHIVRYERLVANPEEKVKRLCRFLGEPYDVSLLDVPKVNTSDKPYEVEAGARGMSSAHVNYYMTTLSDAEIVAIEMLCARAHLRRLYPDLPHYSIHYSWAVRLKAMGLIASGLLRYPVSVVKRARRNGFHLRSYFTRRAGSVWGLGWASRPPVVPQHLRPAIAGLIAVLMGLMAAIMSAISLMRMAAFE